jgi:D-alanyl-D-alanine carboxypeptidase
MNIFSIIQNFVKKSKSLEISRDLAPEKLPQNSSTNASRRRFFQQVGVLLTASLMPRWLFAKGQRGQILDIFGYPVGETYQYVRPGRSSVRNLVNFRGTKGAVKLRKEVFQAYLILKRQATTRGVYLFPVSGYRSLIAQQSLYRKYGASRAEKPGYSEHNIGTAIDFGQVRFMVVKGRDKGGLGAQLLL